MSSNDANNEELAENNIMGDEQWGIRVAYIGIIA